MARRRFFVETVRNGQAELTGDHAEHLRRVLVNLIDFEMDLQTAIDWPRVFFEGDITQVERGISAATVDGLTRRGHRVAVRPLPLGGGQAIAIDWTRGVLIGASDPRKDGCALGY